MFYLFHVVHLRALEKSLRKKKKDADAAALETEEWGSFTSPWLGYRSVQMSFLTCLPWGHLFGLVLKVSYWIIASTDPSGTVQQDQSWTLQSQTGLSAKLIRKGKNACHDPPRACAQKKHSTWHWGIPIPSTPNLLTKFLPSLCAGSCLQKNHPSPCQAWNLSSSVWLAWLAMASGAPSGKKWINKQLHTFLKLGSHKLHMSYCEKPFWQQVAPVQCRKLAVAMGMKRTCPFEDELRDLLTYTCPYTGKQRCPGLYKEKRTRHTLF